MTLVDDPFNPGQMCPDWAAKIDPAFRLAEAVARKMGHAAQPATRAEAKAHRADYRRTVGAGWRERSGVAA